MTLTEVKYKLKTNSREAIRSELVNLFLKEKCGSGSGDLASRYIYNVEEWQNYKVILQRPAHLNKGFDFVVKVEKMYFATCGKRKRLNPSHENIITILKQYRQDCQTNYADIRKLINKIYQCQDIDNAIQNLKLPPFIDDEGIYKPIEMVLYSLKWLFIEQDITYWNYSGRNMLFAALQKNGLV